jgi:hypothetical protein
MEYLTNSTHLSATASKSPIIRTNSMTTSEDSHNQNMKYNQDEVIGAKTTSKLIYKKMNLGRKKNVLCTFPGCSKTFSAMNNFKVR